MYLNLKEWFIWFVLILWVLVAISPMSFWYSPGSLFVSDFNQGDMVEIRYNGGPIREFKGSYSVIVKNSENVIVAEDRSAVFSYSPENKRPVPLYMEWWAPGIYKKVRELPEDFYTVTTCWTLEGPSDNAGWVERIMLLITPSKNICTNPSNIFEVTE